MCKIQQFILYPMFLSLKFTDTVFAAFIDAVKVTFADTFVDALSATYIITSHVITELSIVLAKYLPFSQLHVPKFELLSFSHKLCYFEFLNSQQHVLLFHFSFKLHLLMSNLHLHSHDTCFVNTHNLFIPIITSLKLKFPVLFKNTYFIK